VLAIGPRLGEMTTGGYELLMAPRPKQKLVHLHAGAEELGRVDAGDLLLQSSMACAAPALATLEAPSSPRWAEWTRAAVADYEANRQPTPVSPLDMAEVVQTLARHLPADTVFTNGAGNFSGWLHRFYRYPGLRHAGRTQLAPTSGAMGYSLPAAVAAALLEPHRTVVNLAGDGDFLMSGQELATAMTYGAKRLVSIVVDNRAGTIRMHQEREFQAGCRAAISATRTSRRWPGPTAGGPATPSPPPPPSSRRCRRPRRGTPVADPPSPRCRRDHQPDHAHAVRAAARQRAAANPETPRTTMASSNDFSTCDLCDAHKHGPAAPSSSCRPSFATSTAAWRVQRRGRDSQVLRGQLPGQGAALDEAGRPRPRGRRRRLASSGAGRRQHRGGGGEERLGGRRRRRRGA
jgi:hypothetical protein